MDDLKTKNIRVPNIFTLAIQEVIWIPPAAVVAKSKVSHRQIGCNFHLPQHRVRDRNVSQRRDKFLVAFFIGYGTLIQRLC